MKRLVFVMMVLCVCLAWTGNCAKEDTDITEDLVSYLYLCPTGISACYGVCGTTWDTSGNGTIEPSEEPNYRTCTNSCDSKCSVAFLYTLTN